MGGWGELNPSFFLMFGWNFFNFAKPLILNGKNPSTARIKCVSMLNKRAVLVDICLLKAYLNYNQNTI